MFDAINYFKSYGISFITEGTKHCQDGWVQISCPFCIGNPGYHLGFNLSGSYFNCWRCGFHSNLEVIKLTAGVNWTNAKEILNEFEIYHSGIKYKKKIASAEKLILPKGNSPLNKKYALYLKRRRFNPYYVIKNFKVSKTKNLGSYKHRLIIPIYFNNILVSFQGRDITNKSKLKYKACKIENEVIHHKNILYGLDLAKDKKVILVEGVTDVWRLGAGSVASFGIKMKQSQLCLLAERFEKIFIMFDDDPEARKQSEKIGYDLNIFGLDVEIIHIKGDPGDLDQRKALKIKKKLLGF